MGRIEKVVEKFAVQTAVYWGSPTNDMYGGVTYAAPIEFLCRWEDINEVKLPVNGVDVTSSSSILTNEEMENEGWCFLGTLDDLDALEASDSTVDKAKPETVPGAYIIRQKSKIPMVKATDDFVRTYYLFDYGK